LAIFALLSLGLLSGITGWMIYEDIGGDWLEDVHEVTASLMLAVVGIQGTSKNRFSMHAHPVGMGSAAFPGQMRPKFTSD